MDAAEQREIVTVREHLETRCDERTKQYFAAVHNCERAVESLRQATDEKLNWIEAATKTTAEVMDKRLAGMNEIQAILKDSNARNITRQEMGEFKERVDADLRVLRESRAELKGMATQNSVIITFILAAAGAIAGIAALIR